MMTALLLLLGALQKPADWTADVEKRYAAIVRRHARSVVPVRVVRETLPPRNPFGRNNPMLSNGVFDNRPKDAMLTGVAVGAREVLTTCFNVDGTVTSIEIVAPDGTKHPAVLKGFDAVTDLALVEGSEALVLEPVKVEGAVEPAVGMALAAVGAAPEGGTVTLTPGIVSALDRVLGFGIQHDAKLNFANVGGLIVDLDGRVLAVSTGISTGHEADSPGQNSGVGMAILWPKVVESVPYLQRGGKNRGAWVGIKFQRRDDGAWIQEAIKGDPGYEAGIRDGDQITEFDGRPVHSFTEVSELIRRRRAGDRVALLVKRGDEELNLEVVLGEKKEAAK